VFPVAIGLGTLPASTGTLKELARERKGDAVRMKIAMKIANANSFQMNGQALPHCQAINKQWHSCRLSMQRKCTSI
jgi:hypothetical protein